MALRKADMSGFVSKSRAQTYFDEYRREYNNERDDELQDEKEQMKMACQANMRIKKEGIYNENEAAEMRAR